MTGLSLVAGTSTLVSGSEDVPSMPSPKRRALSPLSLNVVAKRPRSDFFLSSDDTLAAGSADALFSSSATAVSPVYEDMSRNELLELVKGKSVDRTGALVTPVRSSTVLPPRLTQASSSTRSSSPHPFHTLDPTSNYHNTQVAPFTQFSSSSYSSNSGGSSSSLRGSVVVPVPAVRGIPPAFSVTDNARIRSDEVSAQFTKLEFVHKGLAKVVGNYRPAGCIMCQVAFYHMDTAEPVYVDDGSRGHGSAFECTIAGREPHIPLYQSEEYRELFKKNVNMPKGLCFLCYVPQRPPFNHPMKIYAPGTKAAVCTFPDILKPFLYYIWFRMDLREFYLPRVEPDALDRCNTLEKYKLWITDPKNAIVDPTSNGLPRYLELFRQFLIHARY